MRIMIVRVRNGILGWWIPRFIIRTNMAASIYVFVLACSRACQKIDLGTPGFEDFGFLIYVAHFKNAEIVIWCYLFIYYSVETVILALVYFRGFSKLIFRLLRGRASGANCHFRLRSTTSGPHFDLHDTHSLRRRHTTERMS